MIDLAMESLHLRFIRVDEVSRDVRLYALEMTLSKSLPAKSFFNFRLNVEEAHLM
jgi:hypothetical protein